MKTLKFFPLFLCLFFSMSLMTSCKKDKDITDVKQSELTTKEQSFVATWDVVDGQATVFSKGSIIYQGEISTAGIMSFKEDKTGSSSFSMTILGDTDFISGNFNWEIDGFEMIMNEEDGSTGRWAIVDDEVNNKSLQYTHTSEDDPDTEVEIQLNLLRK